jgi:acyl-CoA thioesterase-1
MISLRGAEAVLLLAFGCIVACTGGDRGAATRDTSRTTQAASAPVSAGGVREASTPETPQGRGTILFLGTSLTAGLGLDPDSAFPQQLQRKIDAAHLPYQTVNAGVSGETSAGLLRRLDWILQRPAQVIVVETGANDGLRGQPVAGTRATIGQVLTRVRRDQPEARVALVQMEAPTNLGKEYTAAFHAMFPALAQEHAVTLFPFLLDGVAGFPRLNQADGVHPNNEGERIVTENLWRSLQPWLREIAVETAPLPKSAGPR